MSLPLMTKATAVWLVDNTTLTFTQIAEFTGLHELEVNGIADGEVAVGMKGFDPIANNQLDAEEIARCEGNPKARLKLKHNPAAIGEQRRKGPRYTPLSKRQERPAAIAWLVRYHPELSEGQIMKLVGTTKPTIQAIRNKTHWNASNIQPVDPVAVGLCKQIDLDEAVRKAAARKAREQGEVMSAEDRMNLLSTDESLAAPAAPRMPSNISGLENFSLVDSGEDPRGAEAVSAEDLFNLPESGGDDDQPLFPETAGGDDQPPLPEDDGAGDLPLTEDAGAQPDLAQPGGADAQPQDSEKPEDDARPRLTENAGDGTEQPR